MRDWHVYARQESKDGLNELRETAKNSVEQFLFSATEAVYSSDLRFYCHVYALEVAYRGNQYEFDTDGEIVDGNNEHMYPRYTLYYATYSETLKRIVLEVLQQS